jgi:hypothetical protein
LAILTCHVCGQKLRIPDGKRGRVACPCGAEWFYPETIELSDVEFRCSMSGARFNVISARRSPLHKFVIQEIKRFPTAAAEREVEQRPSSQKPAATAAETPSLPPASTRVGGWLARFVGGRKSIAPREQTATTPKQGVSGPKSAHNAEQYNWSGFSCPYCSATSFVSCSGGHLACDGSAQLRGGRRFHQCFCGSAGFITGTIKSVEGKRLSIEAEGNLSKAGSEQLPLTTPVNSVLEREPPTGAELGSKTGGANIERKTGRPADPALPSPSRTNSSAKR